MTSPTDTPTGPVYWRSLREQSQDPALRAALEQEFPGYDPDTLLSSSRRSFMRLAGASMALAGLTLTACRRWPSEQVLAYNDRPEGTIPGMPEVYATMTARGGFARGLFVETFDGRPIKADGSPLDPTVGEPAKFLALQAAADASGSVHDRNKVHACRGVADKWAQASTLDLYDPARSRSVLFRSADNPPTFDRSTWEAFTAARGTLFDGKRVAVLALPASGPATADVRSRFEETFGPGSWHVWTPLNRDREVHGAELAFGRALRPHYDTAAAAVIACFDGDFLADHPSYVTNARGWAKARRAMDRGIQRGLDGKPTINRLYACGPSLNPTLTAADVSLRVRPSKVVALLAAVAGKLGVPGVPAAGELNGSTGFVENLAQDLLAHRGRSLVTVGPAQPAEVHALAYAVNDFLGNLGTTIKLTAEPSAEKCLASITALVNKLNAGEVDTLLVLGGNPVYDAPAVLNFAEAFAKAGNRVTLGIELNETAALSQWHLPQAHAFECWGDGRAWDGTILLQQPLIEPIFGGRSELEVAALAYGDAVGSGYHLVRRAWSDAVRGGSYDAGRGAWNEGLVALDVEKTWRQFVHDGLVAGSGFAAVTPRGVATPAAEVLAALTGPEVDGFEVAFIAGPVLDGRYANNGWLQELPDAVTKVTWETPVRMAIADAERLGVNNGDHVSLTVGGRTAEAPVYVMPGQAPGSLVALLGGGRTVCGPIGRGVSHDLYPLTDGTGLAVGVAVRKVEGHTKLATTTEHHLVNHEKLDSGGRNAVADWAINKRVGKPGSSGYLLPEGTFERYVNEPGFATAGKHGDHRLQLYAPPPVVGPQAGGDNVDADYVRPNPEGPAFFNVPHAWGMSVDLSSCTGCSACVVACQAENNIPVVGKDQVLMSREMHWLRIDTYYKGDPRATGSEGLYAVTMPLACVHCENAPCEQVCPVAATVHDTEGLNTMVYNRCIGTRYCSNNCPYKVRRFNYFDYHSKLETAMFRNRPDDKAGGLQNLPWLGMPDTQQDNTVDPVRRMVFNPEVTVRMRGVMEKCTFCTQRIARAKIYTKAQWAKDKAAGKDVADYPLVTDGEVATACQQACPTGAIVFGDLNDPTSEVAVLQQRNPRAFDLLSELNTRPRTRYLALVKNPVQGAGYGKKEAAGAH